MPEVSLNLWIINFQIMQFSTLVFLGGYSAKKLTEKYWKGLSESNLKIRNSQLTDIKFLVYMFLVIVFSFKFLWITLDCIGSVQKNYFIDNDCKDTHIFIFACVQRFYKFNPSLRKTFKVSLSIRQNSWLASLFVLRCPSSAHLGYFRT